MSTQPTDRQTFWRQLTTPRHVVSILLFYCLLNFVLRLALSPDFLPGEAEQALFGQSLRWGYQPFHPPLMTWISWGLLTASAQSHAAFFLLRDMLMALGLIAYFAAGRVVIGDVRATALATFALITSFAFGWIAHLGSLESVLLTLMLALYLWADAKVIAEGSWRDYVLLGVVTGFGVLTSYIFLILPIALSLALIAVPRFLARLKPLPLLVAVLIAIAIVAPYEILGQVQSAGGAQKEFARSAGIVAVHLIGLLLPYALIFPALFWNACRPLGAQGDDEQRAWLKLYDVAMIVAAAIVIVLLFLLDAKTLKGAWFYPAAMLLPIYLFLRARIAGWSEHNGKIFAFVVLGVALLSMSGRIAVYETQGERCRECSQWWPMREYQDSMQRSGFLQGTILGSTIDLAGNLRGVFPDQRVVTPGLPPQTFGPIVDGQCLVVWEGSGAAPKEMLDYLANALHAMPKAEAERGDVYARLIKTRGHMDSMSYMLLPPGACKY
jgi:Dolichyl-phosphate-mannose-protein mannosyltransferase